MPKILAANAYKQEFVKNRLAQIEREQLSRAEELDERMQFCAIISLFK